MRCPSSVVRPSSVRRPSSLTFHNFDFSSETTEGNLTKLYRKVDLNVLYQVCVFRADRKNKMAALASDWLRHFRLLLWNRWTEFNKNWQEARSQRPLPSLCFSGRSEKQDGRSGLWLAETFPTSPLKPLNGIQGNLTGSKIVTSSTKFVFFGPIGKTRWPPWPLIGWDIFDFSSETAERNSTKLDRKQDLNVFYHVCVFRADRKNKMAALANPPKRWHIVLRCTICGPLGLLFPYTTYSNYSRVNQDQCTDRWRTAMLPIFSIAKKIYRGWKYHWNIENQHWVKNQGVNTHWTQKLYGAL